MHRDTKLGVHLPQFGPAATPDGLIAVARVAEAAGLSSLWVGDHIAFPMSGDAGYPYPAGGVPMGPEDGWLEAVATLAFAAAATETITLGTSVIVAPMRHPLLISKEIATLDVLCGGRLVCGVGFGWWRAEFEAVGAQFERRISRFDEQIEILKRSWRHGVAEYDGAFYAFDRVACRPRPVQDGGPPVWICGMSEATKRRAARYGDGWHGITSDRDELAAARRDVLDMASDLGRDPAGISTSTSMFMAPEPARAAEEVAAIASTGVDHLVISAWWADTVQETCSRLEAFAEATLPLVR